MANTVTNTNNLSLRSILEKDKLTGPNFLDWERNLMIVLRHERKWYVLEEPLPEAPPANAPAATRNAHKKHTDDLLDVGCLMLATMSPDLQAGLMNTSAYDMIRQLRDMFQTQARTERYDATKAFNECKMIKGASVSDHVMKMKRHMDHLERLGHPVPLQLATDTILNSLSEDYKPFVVNYNMNNMEKSIAELHSMLKTAELNMGAKNKPKDVLMVRDGGVKKKHGQGSISKGKGPAPAIQNAPKVCENVKRKGKGKKVKANKARTENRCFTCNEVGHWRQNCPKRHEAGSHSQMKYRDAKGKANIPKFMNNEFMNSFSLWKCFITYLGIRVPITWIDYGWINLKQSRKTPTEAAYILGIKIYRNRSKRLIGLSQSTYIDKILKRFRMDESKKGFIPMQHGIVLSKTQCPVSSEDQDKMKSVPYASAIGSIMYAMLCTRPDVAYSVSVTSRYQQNPGEPHWVAVKNILKYLRRTKEMFLVFGGSEDEISVTGYSDASFQTDRDDFRSQSGYVFTLNGGAISWKSSKQDTIADSTTEAEYIAACDAAKEAVWLRNFLSDLRVVASISRLIDIFCDNSGAVAQAKEPREHHKSRHVLRKYHLIREIIGRGDVRICKIPTENNVADPLTKPLAREKHEAHVNSIGMQYLEASKGNVVVDALSRKGGKVKPGIVDSRMGIVAYRISIVPDLKSEIREWQEKAMQEENLKSERMVGFVDMLVSDTEGLKCFGNRIWVPKLGDLRKKILIEAHKSKYSVHPGTNKMYHGFRQSYWWPGMKKDIAYFVERCVTCLQVKIEHQRPYVDRLLKSAHFLPMKETYSMERLARLYIAETIRLHGTPVSIVSDRDARFTSTFWQSFQREMGTRVNLSTAYHLQTDGQSERTIQTLEDILRACVLDFGGSWEDHLPLIELAYNNSYHLSIKAAPYEVLYGRKCKIPLCWNEVGESQLAGPEVVQITSDKINQVRDRLKTARDRQKSYADKHRKGIEFQVGDQVTLKVSPWKGVIHFGKKGKLSPRYIGPFRITERIGAVAYKLDLPVELGGVHDTFHVSNLRKCLADPETAIPLQDIEVDQKLNFVEEPVAVTDCKILKLRNKEISLVKIQWKFHKGQEATWEAESEMRAKYPYLFND
ncbi:hypothetical protein OSB04_024650 [Centaurea solstitialis]|uniref:Uncharacterized protein n=1 Tax=Centaurea solstitialis TaxID=347529 RepID=A0AA38T602_9ASTR|nr:hypothetical protein OSB04_024650 [Centaurea solstitialis]